MNYRMIFYMTGRLLQLEAAVLLLPIAVAAAYGDGGLLGLAVALAVAAVAGTGMTLLRRPKNQTIYAKEGFIIVALSWLFLSAVGALPFVVSGGLTFVDAFFETVSGFTTTGASVLDLSVANLGHGLMFWRSFTHWIGGMGVLVLMMALVPTGSGRTIHVMRAEVPGPIVGKLVPRLKDTAKILYLIYLGMTVAEMLCLLCAGMTWFDSALLSFGTAGTGGFGLVPASIGDYSAAVQWIITVFMLLFGVNFNLYYLLLIRSFRPVAGNRELWLYLGIFAVATGLITVNILPLYDFGEAVRHAAFTVSSVVTTTGYATTDFNLWPGLSRGIIFLLLFVGGCAGSTAGGLKVSRVMLLGKTVIRELKRLIHPRSVSVVSLEGKRVEETTVQSTTAYFVLYMALIGGIFFVLSFENFSLETNLTAAITCLNNVGPGLGDVGPAGGFAGYSDLSKIVLSFAMLLGRLEIYPLVLALLPGTWTKR